MRLTVIALSFISAGIARADPIEVYESRTPLTCNPGCTYQKSNYVRDIASSRTSEYDPIPPGGGQPDFPLPDSYDPPSMSTCTFFTEYGEMEMCNSLPPEKFCNPTMRMVVQARRFWGVTGDSSYTCKTDRFKPFPRYAEVELPRFSEDNLSASLCPPDEKCKNAPMPSAWFTSNVTGMTLLNGPAFLKLVQYDYRFYLVGKLPFVASETRYDLKVRAVNAIGSAEMEATLIISPN